MKNKIIRRCNFSIVKFKIGPVIFLLFGSIKKVGMYYILPIIYNEYNERNFD